MSDPIKIMNESRQGVSIVHLLTIRLVEPQLSEQLTRHLTDLVESGARTVLIDLGAVDMLSSIFFRSFIIAGKKATERKAAIAFCNMSPLIKEGFNITGIDRLFKIFDNEAKALSALGEKE